MKRYIFIRMLGLLVIYIGVFMLLGVVQFSTRGIFTKQVGNLVVTTHYRSQNNPNHYSLSGGDSRITFGGMEFSITNRNNGFSLIRADGKKEYVLPESMVIFNKTVTFKIPGRIELVFTSQYAYENPELMIQAVLEEDTVGLELPYKPLRGSRIQERGDGQFVLLTDEGTYRFDRHLRDSERYVLFLSTEAPTIFYLTVPEVRDRKFAFKDFIIAGAQDKQSYDKVITRWRDQSFSQWSRSISTSTSEDLVIAYSGEAVSRGTYSAAVAAVPAAFLNGNQRTYESAVFLGRLDQGLRSLVAAERDKANRFSRLLNEQSLEFLKDPHSFEYFALRGYLNFIETGEKVLRSLDPADLSPDLIPGILEGYSDWVRYRAAMENSALMENPFERFISQVYLLISQGLRKVPGEERVFMFYDGLGDMNFNLQLGKALMIYAEDTGNSDWAAIGRSLIVSVLSLVSESGTAPARLLLLEDETIQEDPNSLRFSSAQFYRILTPGNNYPHGVSIGAPDSGLWAWTGASALVVSQENYGLDISVSFPVRETHYILIRGVPLPTKIQLYDIDYRTAPDFERYNSSGWSYSASEQTLLLKMQHRSPVEHIRIFN